MSSMPLSLSMALLLLCACSSACLPDGSTLLYRLAADVGTFFCNNVWNGARLLIDALERDPTLCAGKAVLELGAGAGLPSLVAGRLGARVVVASDYPDASILGALNTNVALNSAGERVAVEGHCWGTDVAPLLRHAGDGAAFELALLADVMWKHDMHDSLLRSLHACMAPGGVALVAFSHHVPGHRDNDLRFFSLAAERHGVVSELWHTASFRHLFNDKQQEVLCYRMVFPAAGAVAAAPVVAAAGAAAADASAAPVDAPAGSGAR